MPIQKFFPFCLLAVYATTLAGRGAMIGTFDGIFVLTQTVSGQTLNEFVTAFRIL